MYKLIRCNEARDKMEMAHFMSDQFQLPFDEILGYLETLHMNWGLSVKALDDEGKTIGFLTISDYSIEEETESIKDDNPCLLQALNKLNYISVFSFVVDPKYRGTQLNYDMLMSIMGELKNYDFIFVPVMHSLKTHDYWKRWGAIQFYEDHESKFYAIPNNEKVKIAIDLLA